MTEYNSVIILLISYIAITKKKVPTRLKIVADGEFFKGLGCSSKWIVQWDSDIRNPTHSISLTVSCLFYAANDESNQGSHGAGDVYDKALPCIELLSSDTLDEVVSRFLAYYVQNISNPLF